MKAIRRTLVILVMAILVICATIAFSRFSLASQLITNSPTSGFAHQDGPHRGSEDMEGDASQGGFAEIDSQGGFPGGIGKGRRIEAGFDWSTWLKNLSIICVIVFGTVLLDKVRFHNRSRANKTA
jgi:hypothetical protein